MNLITAWICWVIVPIWLTVLGAIAYFDARNKRARRNLASDHAKLKPYLQLANSPLLSPAARIAAQILARNRAAAVLRARNALAYEMRGRVISNDGWNEALAANSELVRQPSPLPALRPAPSMASGEYPAYGGLILSPEQLETPDRCG